ncbi:MAG: hypothetical protein JW731_02590 [Bacteroidales bacterium]|nr:hypothetical protein [Bacteroidales bacterium]
MKRFMILLLGLSIIQSVLSQKWEVDVQRIDKHTHKTIKLKPESQFTIGNTLVNTDTLKEFSYFDGLFLKGTKDTLCFKLKEVQSHRIFTSGVKQQTVFPASLYPGILPEDSNSLKMALADIDFLKVKNPKWQNTVGEAIVEPLIWISIITLFVSPNVSYNYKEGKLDTERYKYWALGSTLGLVVGFGSVIIINGLEGTTTFKFKPDWPGQKASLWKFTP